MGVPRRGFPRALKALLNYLDNRSYNGNRVFIQSAPAAKTTSATLTTDELLGGLITSNQGAAGAATYTTPTGAEIDAALGTKLGATPVVGESFQFSVVNISTVAAEDATVAGGTGVTMVGNAVVESNEATAQKGAYGTFLFRKTGVATYSAYRVG